MVTPFVTGAVTGWWIQGTIFQLKNLTGIIFWWWWWPTCSFYLQGMHFSSETAKSLEIRKCNFINLICQNLTINKFHRLRVPPNQAQHNESANSVQKTSGRRKMMTILESFWTHSFWPLCHKNERFLYVYFHLENMCSSVIKIFSFLWN